MIKMTKNNKLRSKEIDQIQWMKMILTTLMLVKKKKEDEAFKDWHDQLINRNNSILECGDNFSKQSMTALSSQLSSIWLMKTIMKKQIPTIKEQHQLNQIKRQVVPENRKMLIWLILILKILLTNNTIIWNSQIKMFWWILLIQLPWNWLFKQKRKSKRLFLIQNLQNWRKSKRKRFWKSTRKERKSYQDISNRHHLHVFQINWLSFMEFYNLSLTHLFLEDGQTTFYTLSIHSWCLYLFLVNGFIIKREDGITTWLISAIWLTSSLCCSFTIKRTKTYFSLVFVFRMDVWQLQLVHLGIKWFSIRLIIWHR